MDNETICLYEEGVLYFIRGKFAHARGETDKAVAFALIAKLYFDAAASVSHYDRMHLLIKINKLRTEPRQAGRQAGEE